MCKSQHTVSSYCWLMATITFITKKKELRSNKLPSAPGQVQPHLGRRSRTM